MGHPGNLRDSLEVGVACYWGPTKPRPVGPRGGLFDTHSLHCVDLKDFGHFTDTLGLAERGRSITLRLFASRVPSWARQAGAITGRSRHQCAARSRAFQLCELATAGFAARNSRDDGPTPAGGDYSLGVFVRSIEDIVECGEAEAGAVMVAEYVVVGGDAPDVMIAETVLVRAAPVSVDELAAP